MLAVEHGADAIVVSNHGARQLDRVAAPIDVLRGDRRGRRRPDGDLGRRRRPARRSTWRSRSPSVPAASSLGRPMLWALATAGAAGVARALELLREDLEVTFALLGTPNVGAITRAHVG